jgi:hypothetical protein
LEIIEGVSKDGAGAKSIGHRGKGLAAISLKVPNIEDEIAWIV